MTEFHGKIRRLGNCFHSIYKVWITAAANVKIAFQAGVTIYFSHDLWRTVIGLSKGEGEFLAARTFFWYYTEIYNL